MQKHIFNKASRLFCCMLPAVFCCNPLLAGTMNFTQQPVWDVGVQALYLKPSYSGGFAYLDDSRVGPNTDRRNPLKLDWGWGFKTEASYHFCPNSDVNLNWYHFQESSDGTFVFRTNPTADNYTIKPEWNAVNLEYGHIIHFDQIKNLRLHGGLQYAQVQTKYHGNGVDPFAGPGTEDDFMKYNGVGPRVGADLSVGIIQNCLSVFFGGDAALLVGRSQFTFNETFGTPYSNSGYRPTVVVPEVGLKLGGRYGYTMPCGSLLFDVGYQSINYFDVLHVRDNFAASETNFALNGWFAGIKWILG